MVFSSLIFLYAFLPACLLAYILCPGKKAKNVCLLVFSLVFYAWGEPKYVLLLMFMAYAPGSARWVCKSPKALENKGFSWVLQQSST